MEYILTDLPQYVRITPRSNFSSSVVSSGAVLLFSEDGYTLTGKLPDGTFITIGDGSGGTDVSDTTAQAANVQSGYYFYTSAGVKTEGTLTVSGGVDVSDTTATAAMVLSGAVFHDSTGAVTTGTIPTVSAYVYSSGFVYSIEVPSGYISGWQSFNLMELLTSALSSTTAEAGDVLLGKTFRNSGGVMTSGTIPIISGGTMTPTTSNQIISSGVYLGGSQTILGDAALVGSNIVSGVSIFGVSGTASGSTDFYKCATVSGPYTETYYVVSSAGMAAVNGNYTDTGTTSGGKPVYSYTNSGTTYYLFYDSGWEAWFIYNSTTFSDYAMDECYYYKSDYEESWTTGGGGSGDPPSVTYTTVVHDLPKTWTGYQAVFSGGSYSYQSAITSGLTYGAAYIPQVGKIYTDGATVYVAQLYQGLPTSGLVFYAPLNTSATAAETGQSLTYAGSCTFATYKGIPSMRLSDGCLTTGIVAQSGLDSGFTLSLWICDDNFSRTSIIAHMGDWDGMSGHWWGLQTNNGSNQLYYQAGVGAGDNSSLQNDTWYHVIYEQINGRARAWINGVADLNTSATTAQCSGLSLYFGALGGEGVQYSFNGCIAAIRLYNRTLTEGERDALLAEFAPSAS